ncbi:hypothetical protein [Kribbella lupini]|uniref:Uncharacterized protein n=1 Tax=Kribbella lupini TaxID=291602 RepID=A0ABP4LFM5_9ACTN
MLLPLAAVLVPALPAAADPTCPFPAIADVYAYQQTPEATMLTGRVDPAAHCPSDGTLTSIDSGEQISFSYGSFEIPLGTESGDWYLSSLTVWDVNTGTPEETRTFQPTAPYLIRVLDPTRITSTEPASYVGYGDRVTVSGYLEGWTAADGWRRMPGRDLSIATGNGSDGHPPVPTVTDASGAYRLSVRVYNSWAGGAMYAGTDQWLRSYSYSQVQVHGLVSADVSDRTPGVGQRIVVTGKVAPGAVPVWLERLVGEEWVKVSPTVTATANGYYRLTYRATTRGVQQLRVWNDGTEPEGRMGIQPYSAEFKLAVHR